MIALDTNVIVRFLTADDKEQFARAKQVFVSNENIFIADTVLLESEWVLRYAYNFTREEINASLSSLLGLANVSVANPSQLKQALQMHLDGYDFADALHLVKSQTQADRFLTFDKEFVKTAKGLRGCDVMEP